MLSSGIPPDVWSAVRLHLRNPQHHITLSQLCQTSRAIYQGQAIWKQLCRSIGVGRAISEREQSWKNIFMEVVGHRKRCKVPTCYQFGVPPMYAAGDLLPSPQAVLEHVEYLKSSPPLCRHGHTLGGDADESDEGAVGGTPPAAVDDIMTGLLSMLGIMPPPVNLPLDLDSLPMANPPIPRLLPLSMKNRRFVPHQPTLHPFLAETGAVRFGHFLAGKTSINPFSQVETEGIDWDVDREQVGERSLVDIKDHPLLSRAFATNPPVTEIRFAIEQLEYRMVNRDGTTIKDTIDKMNRYLNQSLSASERERLCTCGHGPDQCLLKVFSTRLDYLYRHFRKPDEQAERVKDNKVPDVWLRAHLHVALRDGKVGCVLAP